MECELIVRDSALKELIADVCTDSDLDESKLDQGLTLRVLAKRIGATKLEAITIASYTQHLNSAKSELMVSVAHAFCAYCLKDRIGDSNALCHRRRDEVRQHRRLGQTAMQGV